MQYVFYHTIHREIDTYIIYYTIVLCILYAVSMAYNIADIYRYFGSTYEWISNFSKWSFLV